MIAPAVLSSRSVLIPLAGGPTQRPGRLARVLADGTVTKANDAGLNRRIADLLDWGLFEAGSIAAGAVQRLQLAPHPWALWRRLSPQSLEPSLSVTNGPDIVGLTPENSRSAELGLALAMAMYAAQSPTRQVMATGELARDAAPGPTASQAAAQAASPAAATGGAAQSKRAIIRSVIRSDDVAILPVGEINRKLAGIRHSLETGKLDPSPARPPTLERIALFLPVRTVSGNPTVDEHATELQLLADACALAGLTLDVHPVATLRQALKVLDIEQLPLTWADRLFTSAIGAVAAAAMIATGASSWLNARIDLAFVPTAVASGTSVMTPTRAVFRSGKALFELQPTCRGAQGLPLYRVGESLILRVAIANRSPLTERLGGYRFAAVTVSEVSGIKVHPEQSFEGVTPTSAVALGANVTVQPAFDQLKPGGQSKLADGRSIAFAVTKPAEPNKVIIIARRLREFDAGALERELADATAGKPANQRINAVVVYLSGRVPGYLDYSFLGVEGDATCEK
jgi:hypothetical protein